jgi:hypothetical protein
VTTVVALLAVVVTAWFGAGTVWNVRKGSALMRWMQEGLPLLGERTTVRWLGSSAVEMCIRQAKPPFAEVTLIIFLEPRDLPWWGLSRRLGRRDTIIIRAKLRRTPDADLEALEPWSWSSRDVLHRLPATEWSRREPAAPGDLSTWFKTPAALAHADALVELAHRSGLTVRRLSVRRAEPHFQLHLAPPRDGVSAREYFEAVRALGERAPR